MANFAGYLKDKNGNKLYLNDIYSQEETITNKVFLDKPVYRKVFIQDVAKNSNVTISLAGLNHTMVWINNDASFNQYNGIATSCPVNWYSSTTDTGIMYINPSGVVIKNTSSWDRTYYVVIEYTKN